MAISCGDPERLKAHIRISYPKAQESEPSNVQTKFSFPDKSYVNVFANGTVNFQGKDSPIRHEIENQVEIINRE